MAGAEPLQRVPFNVVDEVVHLFDSDAEPWSIQLEVHVGGSLDEGRLRAALGEALMRHPMARASKVATGSRGEHRYCWEITPQTDLDPLRILECPSEDALDAARSELQSRSVPLSESPPHFVCGWPATPRATWSWSTPTMPPWTASAPCASSARWPVPTPRNPTRYPLFGADAARRFADVYVATLERFLAL